MVKIRYPFINVCQLHEIIHPCTRVNRESELSCWRPAFPKLNGFNYAVRLCDVELREALCGKKGTYPK